MAATPFLHIVAFPFSHQTNPLSSPSPSSSSPSIVHIAMLSFSTFCIIFTLCILIFSLYTALKRLIIQEKTIKTQALHENGDTQIEKSGQNHESDPDSLSRALLLEALKRIASQEEPSNTQHLHQKGNAQIEKTGRVDDSDPESLTRLLLLETLKRISIKEKLTKIQENENAQIGKSGRVDVPDPDSLNRTMLLEIFPPGKVPPLPENEDTQIGKTSQARVTDPNELTRSLLLEILPDGGSKWGEVVGGEEGDLDGGNGSGQKRKKKRGRKKRSDPNLEGEKEKEELICLYPFTKSSSSTQRKIKQQYDQLVKSHESSGLTLAQVGQFVNCLIEARNELQQKSEVIKRKFTITKALLVKANRSSFDRLHQQISKLELEQKRLEEDAFVYNWLQQQLKLSPAYKKMMEIGARVEMEAKLNKSKESVDSDISDLSFEELLAQEKKDSFWQKNGRFKTCSG